MNYHTPVMTREVIEGLLVRSGGVYIDATVGGGGHTKAILDAGATVLGIDRDADAIEEVKIIKNSRFKAFQGSYSAIELIARGLGIDRVDGVLFDFGVSSHQLDDPRRGFSYRFDEAPLDMRFDVNHQLTAYEVLENENQATLKEIFETYGEEEHAGDIAHAIVRARQMNPILTAGALLTIIKNCTKGSDVNKTASRIFQAIRMYVNQELPEIKKGLAGALKLMRSEGRLAVISYHSLEDRIVKQFFQSHPVVIITKKPITASEAERNMNRRARSAKLRIAEKL